MNPSTDVGENRATYRDGKKIGHSLYIVPGQREGKK